MDVILVRHTSVEVPKGVCYGNSDVPVASTFIQEAAAVKDKLNTLGLPDAVFCSPLTRCRKLASFCGYPNPEIDIRIIELNFGDWEMKSFSEIKDPRIQEWFEDWIHVAPTAGESLYDQYCRVVEFIKEKRAAGLNRILIFAHGGILMCARLASSLDCAKEISEEEAVKVFSSQPSYGEVLTISF